MSALLVAFGVLGLLLIATGSRFGRKAFWVGALAPAATIAWVVFRLSDVIGGQIPTQRVAWVPGLDLFIDLRLDGFAATMTLIIAVVGVLVFAYAASYFPSETPDLGRLAGLLVLFAGAMVGLVLADQLLVLYAFWEITSITSYLLIGNTFTDRQGARGRAPRAPRDGHRWARDARRVRHPRAGGRHLSAQRARRRPGTDGDRRDRRAGARAHRSVHKVGPVPVPRLAARRHGRPDAGERLPALGDDGDGRRVPRRASHPGVRIVLALAAARAHRRDVHPRSLGGLRAIRQHDLKLLLAFGTVSQLGLMMVLFGAGTAAAATAGWVLLIAHAAFKAALFMVVGILDRQTGTRDIRRTPATADEAGGGSRASR